MARSLRRRLEEVEAGARALDETSGARRGLEELERLMHCPSYRQLLHAESIFTHEQPSGRPLYPDLLSGKQAFRRTEEARALLAAAERELQFVVAVPPPMGGRVRYEYRPPAAPEAPGVAQDGPAAADGPASAPEAPDAAAAMPAAPAAAPAAATGGEQEARRREAEAARKAAEAARPAGEGGWTAERQAEGLRRYHEWCAASETAHPPPPASMFRFMGIVPGSARGW